MSDKIQKLSTEAMREFYEATGAVLASQDMQQSKSFLHRVMHRLYTQALQNNNEGDANEAGVTTVVNYLERVENCLNSGKSPNTLINVFRDEEKQAMMKELQVDGVSKAGISQYSNLKAAIPRRKFIATVAALLTAGTGKTVVDEVRKQTAFARGQNSLKKDVVENEAQLDALLDKLTENPQTENSKIIKNIANCREKIKKNLDEIAQRRERNDVNSLALFTMSGLASVAIALALINSNNIKTGRIALNPSSSNVTDINSPINEQLVDQSLHHELQKLTTNVDDYLMNIVAQHAKNQMGRG